MLDELPTDFCSLPIIIKDGALYTTNDTAASQPASTERFASASTTDPIETREEEQEQEQERGVEDIVADVADAILDAAENAWQRFSSSVTSQVRGVCTSKVRAVCFEVLKRTDEPETQSSFAYDDDARFLD